jgi:hypothetical protein
LPGFRRRFVRYLIHGALAAACLMLGRTGPAAAQAGDARISLLYTGRSLGALGSVRYQDELDLITEQASAEHLAIHLVRHTAWRAPGLVIFFPSQEPNGDELPGLLAARDSAERIDSVRAFRTNNGLLVQDPRHTDPDLLALLRRNPRTASSYPDLVEVRVTMYRFRGAEGARALVIQEEGAVWPRNPEAWEVGEMNRVDLGDARLFGLPANLGQIGPRATVLHRVAAEVRAGSVLTLVADLGERDGELGIARPERARVDYAALRRLGYSIAVPFGFELALGAPELARVKAEFPAITFLAANIRAKDSTLFEPSRIVEAGGLRLGLVGLVDPGVRVELPRATLESYRFEPPIDAARREVGRLRRAGVDAVVVLSNLDPADNALIAGQLAGIDAIVADLHTRGSPEVVETRVDLPDRPRSRPGSPALVARGFADGLGVGRLDLIFRLRPDGRGRYLAAVTHRLESVTDAVPADSALVAEIRTMTSGDSAHRGKVLFPALLDLAARHPELMHFDETAEQGRVSRRMWQEFMARVLRITGRAEVAIIRQLPQFPSLVGKLREDQIRTWLWTEDQAVVLDLQGGDLKRLLLDDRGRELVLSDIDRDRMTVMGRPIDEVSFYRVATTDVIFEGSRASYFQGARRVRRNFRIAGDGTLEGAPHGETVALRNLVLSTLQRAREEGKGDAYLDRIAELVSPDPPYENLLLFSFEHPTLWTSLGRNYHGSGYGNVPDARVGATDSWIAGLNGRFKLTYDRRKVATDLGLALSLARQSATLADGTHAVVTSADDIYLDLTLRAKQWGASRSRLQPFLRGFYDTQFAATVNPGTGTRNPRRQALGAVAGFLVSPTAHWQNVEIGATMEDDFSRTDLQYGVHARADGRWPIGPLGRAVYLMRNEVTYFLPTGHDTDYDLALRYGMVHELQVPLVDELSLAVSADFFFYQGKVAATRHPGTSMLLRLGLTYDRLWKPRYQPLF